MNERDLPWVEKFRPTRFEDLVGNEARIKNLFDWVKSWEKRVPSQRGVLLVGPPGTGKTLRPALLPPDRPGQEKPEGTSGGGLRGFRELGARREGRDAGGIVAAMRKKTSPVEPPAAPGV